MHVNNAEKEGTSAIVGKYRRLVKTLKEARIGQIALSGILTVMGGKGKEYRNCMRLTINTQIGKYYKIDKSFYAYVRSKHKICDTVRQLENNNGNIMSGPE